MQDNEDYENESKISTSLFNKHAKEILFADRSSFSVLPPVMNENFTGSPNKPYQQSVDISTKKAPPLVPEVILSGPP